MKMFTSPPWPIRNGQPEVERDFLLWCVNNPHDVLWCRTPAERDAEYVKVMGTPVAGRTGRQGGERVGARNLAAR